MSCAETGNRFPLALIETGKSTGVFVAELGTTFAFRFRVKEHLSVRPSATLIVYYLDHYRRGGERKVPLELKLPVERGVFTLSAG